MDKTKIDASLVKTLSCEPRADALVFVRNLGALNDLERQMRVVKRYPFINAVGVTCTLKEAETLSKSSDVEYVAKVSKVATLGFGSFNQGIVPNCADKSATALKSRLVAYGGAKTAKQNEDEKPQASDAFEPKSSGKEYANCVFSTSTNQGEARRRLTGRGVNLCVMDTGVAPHVDLGLPKNRIVGFKDFVGGKDFPYDDNGHGTFVAGVAIGNGVSGLKNVRGVAVESGVYAIKVIGESGETSAFTILDGMQWLFDNFRKIGVKVVCMSFGANPFVTADPLKIGAEMLTRAGLTVVAASGNDGADGLKSPAISREIISVGAVDDANVETDFSSRGYYDGVFRPDVYALGVGVHGLMPYQTYTTMSGTSVAAPYVAGACCLLHQKYKYLSPSECKKMLLNAADEKDSRKIIKFD